MCSQQYHLIALQLYTLHFIDSFTACGKFLSPPLRNLSQDTLFPRTVISRFRLGPKARLRHTLTCDVYHPIRNVPVKGSIERNSKTRRVSGCNKGPLSRPREGPDHQYRSKCPIQPVFCPTLFVASAGMQLTPTMILKLEAGHDEVVSCAPRLAVAFVAILPASTARLGGSTCLWPWLVSLPPLHLAYFSPPTTFNAHC